MDVVRYHLFEVGDHFTDHAASMRRLLPQAARAMTDGTLGSIGYSPHGWSRLDRRAWPAEQAAAIEAFLIARWQDALATPGPPYDINDIFETCATIARTVTPFLDGWIPGPVADAHLVHCADELALLPRVRRLLVHMVAVRQRGHGCRRGAAQLAGRTRCHPPAHRE
ncbi:hypothetical protein ABZ137_27425 [Streptomyces bobili]|uniref:hypothetical protein n=1 Tax=Streptomyces bobili TaxID=67280 RepID=UPI0033A3210E